MPKKLEKKSIENQSKEDNVYQNSRYNLIYNIINRGAGFIFTILIARLLLAEDIFSGLPRGYLYGIYSLVIAIVFLFLSSLDAGVNTTAIRYVSDSLGKKKETEARTYFQYLLRFKFIFAGIIAFLIFILAKPLSIYIFHKPALVLPLQIGASYFLITSILTSFISAFYFLKKVKYNFIQEIIFQISRIVFVLIFVILLKYKVKGVIFSLSISAFLALIFLIFILTKNYRFLFHGENARINKKALYSFLWLILITSISGSVFVHIDSIMLGALLPQIEFVGFYQAALMIAISVAALITFTNVFFPIFTQKKGKEFQLFFKKVFYYSLLLSAPLTVVIALVSKPFIVILFGQGFELINLPLLMLSLLIIETATGILFTIAFQAKEKPKYPTILTVISAILNIILNYILILTFAKIKPEYGMLGSAIAVIISRYFYFFTLIILAKKHLGISAGKEIYKPILASIIMGIFLLSFNHYFGLKFPLVLLELFFAAVIYLLVLIATKGIGKKDLRLIKFFRF